MTTLQEQLVTQLGSLVSGRVYPIVSPQNTALPHITYQRVSDVPETPLDGSTGSYLYNTRMQVDIWDDNYANCQALATQVRDSMKAWTIRNVLILEQDFFETGVQIYRVLFDYSIWFAK